MSIFLITFNLNCLAVHFSLFRKCLYFLVSNAGVLTILILRSTDYQHYSSTKIFANDLRQLPLNGLLRKSPSILLGFTATKLLIFRKSHKLFLLFLYLRRLFIILFCRVLVKSFIIRLFPKTHFSQMILRFVVSISQRPQQRVMSKKQLFVLSSAQGFRDEVSKIALSSIILRQFSQAPSF